MRSASGHDAYREGQTLQKGVKRTQESVANETKTRGVNGE